MASRPRVFFTFVRQFLHVAHYVREVLLGLVILITVGGITISFVEDIAFGEAIYFAFITGLSIGYGDITPKSGLGHVLSVGIGLIGMIFTGITVAIATRALSAAVHEIEQEDQ